MTELDSKEIGFRTPYTVARFILDTSEIINWAQLPEKYGELKSFFEEFRVFLARTDVVDTELGGSSNEKCENSIQTSASFLEIFGACIVGHSRLDHTVVASQEDAELFEKVKEIVGIRGSSLRNESHDIRDAMHIATGIKYGYTGLITSDSRLLKRDDILRQEFGFRVVNCDDAVEVVRNEISRHKFREVQTQQREI